MDQNSSLAGKVKGISDKVVAVGKQCAVQVSTAKTTAQSTSKAVKSVLGSGAMDAQDVTTVLAAASAAAAVADKAGRLYDVADAVGAVPPELKIAVDVGNAVGKASPVDPSRLLNKGQIIKGVLDLGK